LSLDTLRPRAAPSSTANLFSAKVPSEMLA
jgi:hypothetical protein